MAIAVEVTRPDLFPTRPGIGAHGGTAAADYARPVHFPDCGLAIRVLPQEVGMTVGIQVTRADMVGDIGGELRSPLTRYAACLDTPAASAMAVGLASCTSMSRMTSSCSRLKLGFLP